jgi:hypothetical protein
MATSDGNIVTKDRGSKRETFTNLAEKRTNMILERIRILGNLSNRSAYEFSDDDVRKIFSAIEHELKITKAKFQTAGAGKQQFRLSQTSMLATDRSRRESR